MNSSYWWYSDKNYISVLQNYINNDVISKIIIPYLLPNDYIKLKCFFEDVAEMNESALGVEFFVVKHRISNIFYYMTCYDGNDFLYQQVFVGKFNTGIYFLLIIYNTGDIVKQYYKLNASPLDLFEYEDDKADCIYIGNKLEKIKRDVYHSYWIQFANFDISNTQTIRRVLYCNPKIGKKRRTFIKYRQK